MWNVESDEYGDSSDDLEHETGTDLAVGHEWGGDAVAKPTQPPAPLREQEPIERSSTNGEPPILQSTEEEKALMVVLEESRMGKEKRCWLCSRIENGERERWTDEKK
ncbi:MAG: hypothetical protein Q9196_006434, partial [Gyalolechia fulgens]